MKGSPVVIKKDAQCNMKKPLKIALIHDTDGRRNIGCRLTSGMLKRNLLEASERVNPRVIIEPIPWPFPRRTVLQELRSYTTSLGEISQQKLKYLATIEYGSRALEKVKNADLIIFQPEGRISRNDSAEKIFRMFSLPLYSSCFLKKKVLLLNGTLCGEDDKNYELIKFLTKHFYFISCRDELSARAFNAEFVPDAAFSRKPSVVGKHHLSNRKYVAISTTAGKAPAENVRDARRALEVCKILGKHPLILTMDYIHLESLFGEVISLGGRVIDYADISYAEELLSDCVCHIGGRYHMAILSAVCGVPSFLVETNSHKNEWLVENIYGISWLAELELAELEAYLERLEVRKIKNCAAQVGGMHERALLEIFSSLSEYPMEYQKKSAHMERMCHSCFACIRQDMNLRLARRIKNIFVKKITKLRAR